MLVCPSLLTYVSAEALDLFLKKNDLSHVIRAHEMKAAGFQVRLPFTTHSQTTPSGALQESSIGVIVVGGPMHTGGGGIKNVVVDCYYMYWCSFKAGICGATYHMQLK